MDKQFNASYIEKEFEKIAKRINKKLSVYLIGGCAMSFRGLKESTKDVDIVIKSIADYKTFCDALFGAEYYEPYQIKSEHERLIATIMYENKAGFHLDLFVKQVINKLTLSNSMIKRAELYRDFGSLKVYLLSKEDIFLFKGLASEGRKRDLPDMQALYPNINWKVILDELETQKLASELKEMLKRRLEEFSKTYSLDVPILKQL